MQTSVQLLKALADQTRLSIVRSLINKPAYLEELSKRTGLAPSTLSFHMKKLVEAKLVKKRKQQYYVEFEINEIVLQQSLRDIVLKNESNLTTEEIRIQEYEQKILDTFYKDGKLIKLPKQLKKRLVILNHIAMDFQPELEYPEKQVNEMVKKHFDDHCSIRREMIDFMVMKRKDGMYWRSK